MSKFLVLNLLSLLTMSETIFCPWFILSDLLNCNIFERQNITSIGKALYCSVFVFVHSNTHFWNSKNLES